MHSKYILSYHQLTILNYDYVITLIRQLFACILQSYNKQTAAQKYRKLITTSPQ